MKHYMFADEKQEQNPGAQQGNVDNERDAGQDAAPRPNLRDDAPSSAVTGIGHAGRSGMGQEETFREDKPRFDPDAAPDTAGA